MTNPTKEKTNEWYEKYYKRLGTDRNNLLRNKEVLLQYLASEKSLISAISGARIHCSNAKVLDIGCGSGSLLSSLVRLGFKPENLAGVDILAERIDEGKKIYPNITFHCLDARDLPLPSSTFDLTCESTMFVQITDERMSSAIANEMLRVTKVNGYILLRDWRYGKFWDKSYLACSRKRVREMFKVGDSTELVNIYTGALVPPIGRFLSKYCPSLYFLVAGLMPLSVGQVVYLLKKLD